MPVSQAPACRVDGFMVDMVSSQNWGPIFVPLDIRCRNIMYSQKGYIFFRTTHVGIQGMWYKIEFWVQSIHVQILKAWSVVKVPGI